MIWDFSTCVRVFQPIRHLTFLTANDALPSVRDKPILRPRVPKQDAGLCDENISLSLLSFSGENNDTAKTHNLLLIIQITCQQI